jgi:hypothetical protein
MDREQALLCLKWIATQHIDGYWGAGDAHLLYSLFHYIAEKMFGDR